MANTSSVKALAVFFFVAVFSAVASARDFETSPAPAPGLDSGSAYSLPISGAIVCSSVVLSLLALMKN